VVTRTSGSAPEDNGFETTITAAPAVVDVVDLEHLTSTLRDTNGQ
jgi:hypothetical protein